MFSDFVIAYLFLGGAGGGAVVVLALLELANMRRRLLDTRLNYGAPFAPRRSRSTLQSRQQGFAAAFYLPVDVRRGGWVIALVALSVGILFLFVDLGRPERVINLLTHPSFSAMTVGAYALLATLVCAALWCLASLDDSPLSPGFFVVLAIFSFCFGLTAIVYTGILLAQTASVLIWITWLLPVLFTLSSLSCGIAVIMLSAAFANTRQAFSNVLNRLGDIDFFIILLEFAALAAWLIWAAAGEGTGDSARALLTGSLAPAFWLGLVLCGMVLPLFLEQYLSYSNHKTQTFMIAALVLFGGAMLRLCVIYAGNFDVTQLATVEGFLDVSDLLGLM